LTFPSLPPYIRAVCPFSSTKKSVRAGIFSFVPSAQRHHRTAGQDATELFFGLHRQEILYRPQYARLQIGTIEGQQPQIKPRAAGTLSEVPYAEPTWLSKGYHSPYFTDVSASPVLHEYVD